MRNGMITDEYGTQRWYVNDQLHREDGPAVIFKNVSQWWYINDQLHRTDGPAVIWSDGDRRWYLNGQPHRTDGPAVIWTDGSLEWWVNGQRHRVDGPAVIEPNGSQWYLNDYCIAANDVDQWMAKLEITYPFDEEHQALFLLTFGGK